MTDLIPATPGWYVLTPANAEDDGEHLDPVIAWQAAKDEDDGDTLLPIVGSASGYPPVVIHPDSLMEFRNSVVYRPNYDLAVEDNPTHILTPDRARSVTSLNDTVLVTEDGTVVTLNLPADPAHFAEYAAAVLRCTTVEHLELVPGVSLWFDEDGRERWPYNPVIDALRNWYGATDSIHGPVLITGYGDRVEPLQQEIADRILRELNQVSTDH